MFWLFRWLALFKLENFIFRATKIAFIWYKISWFGLNNWFMNRGWFMLFDFMYRIAKCFYNFINTALKWMGFYVVISWCLNWTFFSRGWCKVFYNWSLLLVHWMCFSLKQCLTLFQQITLIIIRDRFVCLYRISLLIWVD